MASLLCFEHSFNLSDEDLVVRWCGNVLWQFFRRIDYREQRPPCDAMQVGRFRPDLGEDGMEQLFKATIDTAVAMKVVKLKGPERVTVDLAVQEKAIAHPMGSRLLEIARHKVVSAAKRARGYAHAKQFRRLKRAVRRQRTILRIVIREVQRKLGMPEFTVYQLIAGERPCDVA